MYDLKVLSLGAGVQSTTLALMAATGEIPPPDCAIFADTGDEPADVYRHVHWLTGCTLITRPDGRLGVAPGTYQEGVLPYPVHIVSAGDIRDDTLAAARGERRRIAQPPLFVRNPDGSQGVLRRACTREYKVEPIRRKIRELVGIEPAQRRVTARVQQWFGLSLDEVYRMKPADVPWITHHYPLIDLGMDRQDCIRWCRQRGYPDPPKSACVACPYHSDHHWRQMRDHQPAEWARAVEFDRAIRCGLPGVRAMAYVHRAMVPLDEVDLRTPDERGQVLFDFGEECEGLCGV